MHTLRCAPCATRLSLEHIDSMLKKGVCAITNLDLTDLQWLQASLPVKEGGLVYVVLPRWHLPLF